MYNPAVLINIVIMIKHIDTDELPEIDFLILLPLYYVSFILCIVLYNLLIVLTIYPFN